MVRITRENKGKSLFLFPDDFTVIDIETTGVLPMYDEIIELSALRIRDNKVVDRFSSLVKPEEEVSSFIEDLTGISNEMLQNERNIQTVLPEYLDFVGQDVLVGHNVNYDVNFIYDYARSTMDKIFSNDFVDTMRLSRYILKNKVKNHKLKTLSKHYEINRDVVHRGEADCIATLELLHKLKHEAVEIYAFVDNLISEFNKRKKESTLLAKNIKAETNEFDATHPLFEKMCVFTGALDDMPRREAMQIVVNLGGICEDRVTKKTNFLILGNTAYLQTKHKGKSSKQKKAEQYKLEGQEIEIIPESVFIDLISE